MSKRHHHHKKRVLFTASLVEGIGNATGSWPGGGRRHAASKETMNRIEGEEG